MKTDKWPVPCAEEIFDDLKGSCIFSTLDLFQGYWQIKMHDSCKEKTTFICKFGTYQFEVMPFGLKNSGATLQIMMFNILVNVTNVKCHFDDVIINSATAKSNVKNLDNVFALLINHELRIQLKKCWSMQPRLELLGHCTEKGGIHPDDRMAPTIRDAYPPSSRKQLRFFLGIASYYQRFVKNFRKDCKNPVREEFGEDRFRMDTINAKSFDTLKQALTTVPVLVYPDFSRPFLVATDASNAAFGAVLSYLDENGRE